ncbi:hypothetical protein DSO57_1026523 [Entomophthora muscae]|uniref:Uncharacterized protein n=1 Tax=Entomophthora muscae TaxID=34485 RepID=A0ACC2SF08_9FUNG|nr:hypothetical protein DSO57_1026523 [Entomophthora muscae]
MASFIETHMLQKGVNRRKLSIHKVAAKKEQKGNYTLLQCGTLIPDLVQWRKSLEKSPFPAPYQRKS